MDNLAWAAIFRQIPVERQHQFTLVTTGGTEITLQSFLRLEAKFVVIKGRLSGSQDAGRVFFLPYSHIDYLGTLHPIKDEEYEELFGTLALPGAAASVPAAVLEAPPTPEVAAGNGHRGANADVGASVTGGSKADLGSRSTIRSEVLERFRSRPAGPASSVNLPNPRSS